MTNVIDIAHIAAPQVAARPEQRTSAVDTRSPAKDIPKDIQVADRAPSPDGKSMPGAMDDRLQNAARQLQDYAQNLDRDLLFSVDETSGRTVITVIDSATDQVIRQIPGEETLALLRALEKGSGALFKDIV